MKKVLKVLGIILAVIVALFLAFFIYVTVLTVKDMKAEKAAEPEVAVEEVIQETEEEIAEIAVPEETDEEFQFSVDEIIDMYEIALRQSFTEEGQGFEVKQDGSVIQVNVWSEGISEEAVKALTNEEYKAAWNNMVENFQGTSKSLQKVLDENGHSDMTALLNVINDASKDKTILAIVDGVVMYDAVNGVDLLSK